MELTKDTTLHGFTVRTVQPLPELKATLYRMEYTKNGADLVWLDRPDDNKTFSIAFKTIPSDHTGVFHILEHSVLCGSRKYPVREPFVELIKSSLQTFLNAMTFPDKTMYPLSSRNDQDFLNLIDVYMDAVLHPLSAERPLGFLQEGWHYELDSEDGELIRNGVVFNEMKGAFVDPDEVMSFELGRALFPDNCYGFESGGHPEHIPELTYEKYLANHARFYHPSNAYIFLDGEVDLEPVLEKLDSFLRDYDRIEVDAEIPMQKPVHPEEITARYEIGPEDDDADKVLLGEGWVSSTFDDPERVMGCAVLARLLCGTNESPLKKAVLEKGLAQDLELHSYDGIQQNFLFLVGRNTSAGKKDELVKTIYDVLREQAGGLDHRQLHAILNQVEFSNREKDFGRMPRGLVFAMTSLESWLYGGDPAQNLCSEEVFASLRKKIDEGWFEKLVEETFLTNPHTARVTLLPSKTLGEEKLERDRQELAAIKAGWGESELHAVMEEFAALRKFQSDGDTPEKLATLPVLSLADIPEKGAELPYEELKFQGVDLLHQDVETGGIVYLELFFDAGDVPVEELKRLPMAATLLGKLSTARRSALELSGLIREKLGRFNVSALVMERKADLRPLPMLQVSVALLPERKAEAVEILKEVLFETSFDDTAAVYNLLRQGRLGLEQAAQSSGNAFALLRAGAGVSAAGALGDAMRGVEQLRFLQGSERDFEANRDVLVPGMSALLKKLLTRSRVTLSVAGKLDESWLADILAILPEGEKGEDAAYAAVSRPAEGFSIPAGIGFAARAMRLQEAGAAFDGSMAVADKLLTMDYLWNNVRVKGGAYGVNMGVGSDGNVSMTSYRDPQCGSTLDVFSGCGQVLRDFAASGEPLDKFIISTIGSLEPVTTPRTEQARAARMHFTGTTPEDVQTLRSQVLHTTPEKLAAFADTLDKLLPASRVCVIGGKPILDACGGKLATIEPIQ